VLAGTAYGFGGCWLRQLMLIMAYFLGRFLVTRRGQGGAEQVQANTPVHLQGWEGTGPGVCVQQFGVCAAGKCAVTEQLQGFRLKDMTFPCAVHGLRTMVMWDV
jgi:hypothetical protein